MSAPDGETRDSATDTLPVAGTGDTRTDASEASWIGRVIAGRYVIERAIGRGGMGFVFEARHVAVGRRVAVKILRPEVARSTEAVARFHREAKAAAAIGHRRIVEVLDFGYSDEGAYLVMELLIGQDLAALMRGNAPLPVGRAVGIARQIAEALEAAHARGIVHRDLKSGNIFVSQRDGRDSIKVLDFGVAKALELDDEAPSTHQGTVVGTPHYMAPEQGTDGHSIDQRADLYALGCLLFEMLAGELPFVGATPVEVLYKHVHEAPRRPSSVRGDKAIPHALDDLVMRLLAKDRDKRPPDASAVIRTLDGIDLGRRGLRARWLLAGIAVTVCVGSLALATRGDLGPTRRASRVAPAALTVDAGERPIEDTGAIADANAPAPTVVVTVVVRPPSAALQVDGAPVASPDGVLVLRATRGVSRSVRAESPGHVAHEERVLFEGDTTLRWTLAATPIARESHPVVSHVTVAPPDDAGPGERTPDGLWAHPPPSHAP